MNGKLVLAHGSSAKVMEEAVWERGAVGTLIYPDPRQPDYPVNFLSTRTPGRDLSYYFHQLAG